MKLVGSYIKRNRLWMACAIAMMAFGVFYMFLMHVALTDLLYFAGVEIFLCAVVFVSGYLHYARRVRRLEECGKCLKNEEVVLPEGKDAYEELYQEMIEDLDLQRREETASYARNQSEMREYYAMWVHQIKTPIAALQLLLETQKKDVAKDAETILEKAGKENAVLENLLEQQYTQNMEQFSDMEEELFCIEQYVGMALQYQRVKSESNDYVFTQVSVDKMVRTVIRKFAKLMIRKKIPMQYEGCRQQVITDEKWCAFVLEQVLSNAIKYTKHGTIRIRIEQELNWLYIVIEDQGIGIRKEDIPRVFEKGYSGYNGHEDKRSTGIGLYLSRQILEKLGHTIRIESEVGKGTAVWIGFSMKQINVQD